MADLLAASQRLALSKLLGSMRERIMLLAVRPNGSAVQGMILPTIPSIPLSALPWWIS
jgi:hypothetical protein